jgi:hypothetical protein
MDWLDDLIGREKALQARLARLSQREDSPPASPAASGHFERVVRPAVEAMQAALDDYLCGRDAEERSWMSYEVRFRLPLFSHLRSVYSLTSAAETRSGA